MNGGQRGRRPFRDDPLIRRAGVMTIAFAGLALYALWSTPGEIARYGATPPGLLLLVAWCGAASGALAMARTVPSRKALAAFAVVALALRGAALVAFAGRVPDGDAGIYLDLARALVAGGPMQVHDPFIGLTFRALFPPAYPLLLAGWIAVAGSSNLSLALLNCGIDAAAAVLIVLLGRRLGHAAAGLAAAALFLIWPSVLLSAPLAQKEGVCDVLILALATLWLDAPGRTGSARARAALAIGSAAGLLALTQPGEAPLAALFALALIPLGSLPGTVAVAVRAVPVSILVMLPWWIRNALVFDAFVPLTSAGGVSLWIGNNPHATGNWMPPPRAAPGTSELGYGREMAQVARSWIAAHPLGALRLGIAKLVRALGVGEFGVERLSIMQPVPSAARTGLWTLVAQASQLAMLAGAAIALARPRAVGRALVLLIAAGLVQLVLVGSWFEFGERHREFLTPFLLLAVTRWFAARRDPA